MVPEWLMGWIANPLFVGSTHHSNKKDRYEFKRLVRRLEKIEDKLREKQ